MNVPSGDPVQNLIAFSEIRGASAAVVPLRPAAIRQAVESAAAGAGFRKVHTSSQGPRGEFQGRKRLAFARIRVQEETGLLVRWCAIDGVSSRIEWAVFVAWDNSRHSADASIDDGFVAWLNAALQAQLTVPPPEAIPRDPVTPPGAAPPTRYEGQHYDYSTLARPHELAAFQRGTLPLGRVAFGWGSEARHGEPLFLPRRDGRPLEELGVLMCAPQGSGKTHLLVTWAAAAAAEGRTVFLVDVKGNLRALLDAAFARAGVRPAVLEFSTDPYAPSDRLDLLAGIDAGQVDCRERLLTVAEALLPADGFGKEVLHHRVAIRVLCGALMVLKLREWYGQRDAPMFREFHGEDDWDRAMDLVDLQALLARESVLCDWILFLRHYEVWLRANDRQQAGFSVEECVELVSIALGRQVSRRLPDGSFETIDFPDGQRPAEYSYQQYLVIILDALAPFRPGGPMADRVRASGDRPSIRLDRIGRDGRPSVVILTVRENDSSLATAILGMAMRRMLRALDDRRNLAPEQRGDLLLLLDETRRIPGFNPADFVSIVRENRVGYVLVYQSLGLVEPREYLPTLLSNIGTQIYLGGLRSEDLASFNAQRAGREAVRQWATRQNAPSGGSRGSSEAGREVPFLSALAAERLPAGRYPALVAVRDGPPPFLVDLDQARAGADGHDPDFPNSLRPRAPSDWRD